MTAGLALSALLLFLSPPPAAAEGPAGALRGIVTRSGAGEGGVSVTVHDEERGEGRTAPLAQVVSDGEGRFGFDLPAGAYFLSAKVPPRPGSPPRIVDYPGNPVPVRAGETSDLDPLELFPGAGVEGARAGTGVAGRVVIDGRPVPDASVMFYPGATARLTGPTYVNLVLTGPDGRFEAALEPGSYNIAVRRRQRGTAFGPPQPGDLSGEFEGNPVQVRQGALSETGALVLHVVDLEKLAGQLGRLDRPAAAGTRLEGKVIDSEGKPLPGQFVFLYGNAEMTGRPAFVTRSGEDGSFVVNPPGGGRYFLAARGNYGVARQLGDALGVLEGSRDSSVEVEGGKSVGGLVIRMKKVW